MDTDRLWLLTYYKFLEQYGELYFQNHPLDDNSEERKYKKKIEKKSDEAYRQGEYAIKVCESRRRKRYPINQDVKKRCCIFIIVLIVALLITTGLSYLNILSSLGVIAAFNIVMYFYLKWDNQRYKNHHGKVDEIEGDLQESEEILQERCALLMSIILNDICIRGYDKDEVVDRFISFCENSIKDSKLKKQANIITTSILSLMIGICLYLSDKLLGVILACNAVGIIAMYLFYSEHIINARIFNRLTREELCQRAVLDCLYYIKLKKFNLNEKPVSKKVKK